MPEGEASVLRAPKLEMKRVVCVRLEDKRQLARIAWFKWKEAVAIEI